MKKQTNKRQAPEAGVQRAIIELLVMRKFLVLRINQGGFFDQSYGKRGKFVRMAYWEALGFEKEHAGISDVVALSPLGHFWVIEVKAPGRIKKVTDAQSLFLREVKARNGIAMVADNADMVNERIDLEYEGYDL